MNTFSCSCFFEWHAASITAATVITSMRGKFMVISSSEVLRHCVLIIVREEEIVREIDLDPRTLADRDGGHEVQEAVHDALAGHGHGFTKPDAGLVKRRAGKDVARSGLGNAAEKPDGERSAKDLHVVVVDLIVQGGGAKLVKSFELVEIDRIPVRHDKAVKEHGEPLLAEGADLIGFAQNLRARRKQDVLPVGGIDIVGDKTVDGAGETPIEPVHEHGVDNRALE